MIIETEEQYQEALALVDVLVFDDLEQLLLEIKDYEDKQAAKEIVKNEF